MKMKTAVRALCAICAATLCLYGIHALDESGELPFVDYTESTESVAPEEQANTEPAESADGEDAAPMEFQAPELDSELAYVHTGYIPTNIDGIEYEQKVATDAQLRVETVSLLVDADHVESLNLSGGESGTTTSMHSLAKNSRAFGMSTYAHLNGLLPILRAVETATTTSDTPVAIRVTLEYTEEADAIPEYVHVEVFTTKTQDVAYKATIHNIDPDGPIDYSTGELY